MKIVTDCAADLSAKERSEFGIIEAPLYIQFPEGEIDATDILPDDFYNRLEAMRPEIPTTAQPSSGLFAELYKKLAGDSGDENQILSIHISSGLSGTLNSADTGAMQLKENVVTTVDTMTLSGGQRFQVLAAAKAAQLGWSIDKILARLDEIRAKTEVIYTLETLEYLARGGRIGRVQALAGSVLKIKPIICVDHADGKYTTVGKGRTIKKNVATMVKHIADIYGDGSVEIIDYAILNSNREPVQKMFSDEKIYFTMQVKFYKKIENPIFAYTIRDIKGLEITGTNTFHQNIDTSNIEEGSIQNIEFCSVINLKQESYMLSLGCTSLTSEGLVIHARCYDILTFEVLQNKDFTGLFNQNATIKIKENN